MFTNIGNITGRKPRETEQSDTRLGIRRHDPDQERRRKKEREGAGANPFDAEDNATVSVEALRLFLQNFLRSLEEKKPEQAARQPQQKPQQNPQRKSPQEAQHEPQHKSEPTPVRGDMAQAAGAYRHAGNAGHAARHTAGPQHDSNPEAMPEEMDAMSGPMPSLPAEDVRAIHRLLADLQFLTEKKVEYLRIERSDSFLHSLEAAVAKAKSTF